jgi:hypothetical protein
MCILPRSVVNHFCGLMSGKAGIGTKYFIPSHHQPNGDPFISIVFVEI